MEQEAVIQQTCAKMVGQNANLPIKIWIALYELDIQPVQRLCYLHINVLQTS
jgi:hypothetical protein